MRWPNTSIPSSASTCGRTCKGGPPAGPVEPGPTGVDETPEAEAARKDGQTAYETKGKEPGAQLDEEL